MRKTKEILMSMIVVGGILLAIPTLSHGALQANGSTPKSYAIDNWIYLVRGMQSSGGTLGLTNNLNWDKTGGKYLTSDNPNLDIHMQKNTEYGAMSILAASSYGNPGIIQNGGTTTGNETGIRINFGGEWVAAGQITETTNYVSAASRYKDNYTATYEAKSGDAIEETKQWHGSTNNFWIWTKGSRFDNIQDVPAFSNRFCGLLRSYSGSIFSYYGYGYNSYYNGVTNVSGPGEANYASQHPTRAVIVVGSGI